MTRRLWVRKANNNLHLLEGRVWLVIEPDDVEVVARFASHRAALNFALWKSGLLKNYGGA